MENFTPLPSLLGGILIGIAAAAVLVLNGRVAGMSGIFAGVLRPTRGDVAWRAAFLAGLLTGGVILRLAIPSAFDFGILRPAGMIAAAGLLVGYGTRLGNGCTSGHGVCGISRLSPRSIVATMVFIAAGAVAVLVVRVWMGGAA